MAKADTEKAYVAEGRLLAAALDERGIGPTQFSEMLKEAYRLRAGPQNVQNWRGGRGFNERNRRNCASLLGLPPDAFEVQKPTSPAPVAKFPSLATLLGERKLRRFTLDAIRALEPIHHTDPGDHYWRTQIDWHEGVAASLEAARFKPVVPPKARKSGR